MRTTLYVTSCIYSLGLLDVSQKNQCSKGGVLRKVSSVFISLIQYM